jgi:hypothetical protein
MPGRKRGNSRGNATTVNAASGRAHLSLVSVAAWSRPLGAVGLDGPLGGFAADPPTGSTGSSDGSTSQLVQAMAGFDASGGAADGLNAAPLSADTSQQTLLTTPQHA